MDGHHVLFFSSEYVVRVVYRAKMLLAMNGISTAAGCHNIITFWVPALVSVSSVLASALSWLNGPFATPTNCRYATPPFLSVALRIMLYTPGLS